jgi:hypothetical protein
MRILLQCLTHIITQIATGYVRGVIVFRRDESVCKKLWVFATDVTIQRITVKESMTETGDSTPCESSE